MPDVLITHSYHLPYDAKQLRKMQPYPPLGMLYAASWLREAGLSVAAFDTMLEEPSQGFGAALSAHRPRIVIVYEDDFNFLSKMCLSRMREVAWEIARAAKERGATTVVHGSDSTDNARLFLENGFDYVLCGEAEQTLAELCRSLLRGESPPDLDGTVRGGSDGTPVWSANRLATNPAWAEIRVPARDLIDMGPYRAAWRAAHGYFSTSVVSSRGCPYRCNWCAKPISGNRFQLRPAADVAAEIGMLKNHGVEHIWFGDDVFALNQEWVRQFAEAVTREDAAVPFKIQSRANLMTEATVRNLKTAGCAEVWMGVESGSQAVLDAMDKGLAVESIVTARERLGRAGIRACYFLQFGYPGEGWRELQQTIALVRDTRPDDIGVSFSYPLPGTVFYEKVQAQLGRKRNWVDSDDLCIMFTGAYRTEFYRAVRDALHAEVDSWKSSGNTSNSLSPVDELWRNVHALEPVSRNPDPLELTEHPRFPSGVVLPLEQLLSSAKA